MKYRFAIPMALLLVIGAAPQRKTDTDWPSFGRDPGAQRYSPLTQITPQNVSQLQPAWSFDTGVTNLQVTPIVIDGLMYLSGGTSVFALEPETGKEIWRYDPKSKVARRGVAYWPGDGTLRPRLFAGVADGRLVSLDARTGEPVATFGDRGFVDLKAGVRGVDGPFMLESPAVVYKNVVITGGANTEGEPSLGLYGDIRGWDARTGRHLWSFHTVPRPGEPGVETWEGESWKNRSGTNAWTYMTLDVERGLVFAATGSATSDFYGADRKGRNLYGELTPRARCEHRKAEVVPAARAPRHLGLGSASRPDADRGHEERPADTGRRADDQDEHAVHLRSPQRRAGVRDGRASGAADRFARRGDVSPRSRSRCGRRRLSRTTFDPATDLYALTPEHAAVLPRPLGRQQDVHARDVHAADGRSNDGDVSEHARRRQLERPVVRCRARPGVHEHHEPRPGRAHGEARRRRRRSRASRHGVQAHVAVGQCLRTVLEPGDEDAVLRAAVRRARRRGRQQCDRSPGACRSASSTS